MGFVVECCFTSTETVSLLGTGAQIVHLDFHTPLAQWAHASVLITVQSEPQRKPHRSIEITLWTSKGATTMFSQPAIIQSSQQLQNRLNNERH